MSVRKASVAGYFYPAAGLDLKSLTSKLLTEFKNEHSDYDSKALIVPHAGYQFSGRVAASAFNTLKNGLNSIQRIILLGPCHHVSLKGIALSSADSFETPMGTLNLDTKLRDELVKQPGIFVKDDAHENEHSLEVQLPFLQQIFKDKIIILPALANFASAYQIADFLEKVWGGKETRILISSDLSHYLTYQEAIEKDKLTSDNIAEYNIENFNEGDACGLTCIKGLLMIAKKKGLTSHCLMLSNSGDVSGERSRVVGYGSFCFI